MSEAETLGRALAKWLDNYVFHEDMPREDALMALSYAAKHAAGGSTAPIRVSRARWGVDGDRVLLQLDEWMLELTHEQAQELIAAFEEVAS